MKFGRFNDDEVLDFDHKTVIVLDHSPAFAQLVDYEREMSMSLKDPSTGQMRVACTVQKSLWSYAVESSLELHRIVDEIYPDGSRLMRFVISDFVGRFLNFEWGRKLIDYDQVGTNCLILYLLKLFAKCGMPSLKADISSRSLKNGVSMAVEALSELTELQKRNDVLRNGDNGLLRSDLFSAAISNMKYEVLSDRERIICNSHAKLCKKHMIRHDASVLKKKKAQDDVVKGKLLYYAKSVKNLSMDDEKKVFENKGSIILFSSFTREKDISEVENQVYDDIVNRNKVVSVLDIEGEDNNFAPITHVNLYIVNLQNGSNSCGEGGVVAKSLTQINDYLSSCVICAEAGASLPLTIRGLAVNHYGLASTTVTGIPMKEETQQGQSVNYDVEILHLRRSHKILEDCGLIGSDSKLRSHVSSSGYDTIKLAWCTASLKSQCVQYSRCVAASTISPANVNSRPSICLTSFLLNHRNVMLEVPKHAIQESSIHPQNANQKVLSHLLMCHSGRIYIHTMWLGRHPVLDNRNIMESALLPKVESSQLRSPDFVALARDCQLKYSSNGNGTKPSTSKGEVFNEQARKRLRRLTRYFPVYLSDAFIYNIPSRFEPLLTLIRKDELSESDVNKCRECICGIIAFRDSKEPLTMKTFECKKLKKLQNKDDQLKAAMRELLLHLRNYVNNSARHMEVYDMFLQLSGLDRTINLQLNDVTLTDSLELW
uniref:Protein asunder n=1 Tax=Syphacia muris TaxID=451379 RepID=A0A0N5ABR0_9BILA